MLGKSGKGNLGPKKIGSLTGYGPSHMSLGCGYSPYRPIKGGISNSNPILPWEVLDSRGGRSLLLPKNRSDVVTLRLASAPPLLHKPRRSSRRWASIGRTSRTEELRDLGNGVFSAPEEGEHLVRRRLLHPCSVFFFFGCFALNSGVNL